VDQQDEKERERETNRQQKHSISMDSTHPTDQRNSISYKTKRDIMMDGGIRKITKRRI
jgi:hypothetical protein